MHDFRRAVLPISALLSILISIPTIAAITTVDVSAAQQTVGTGADQRSSNPPANVSRVSISQDLRDQVQREGRTRVLVELNLGSEPFVAENALADRGARQRQTIGAVRARILAGLPPADHRELRRYQTVPYLALEVGPTALAALGNSPDVVKVSLDEILHPTLAQSVPLIEGDQVWAVDYDGSGTMIAILDVGVDSTHPFLAGKVVEEACYSSNVPGTSQSLCPNGGSVQTGPGAAAPCPLSDCFHGTHVAGIAAGNGANAGVPFSGVAKGAQLMAVQVFSEILSASSCGGIAPCLGAYDSDIVAGLEHAYAVALQQQHNIVSVNMSLGGAMFSAPCDDQPEKPAIDNLRAIGIATTVASGNSGAPNQISTPACISSAVSVGSTDKTDMVSWFSNVAPFLSLFAPGDSITSSVPGGGYLPVSGTSMAAPHVAGAWALIKQAKPTASVSQVLAALQQTGLPITDTRFSGTTTIPRVRVFEALATLVPVTNPSPTVTFLSPAHALGGSGSFTLTINGSGFDAFSVAQWNGVAVASTTVSTAQINASIPAGDLPNVGGTAQVSVFTPAPGGGSSSALTFTIDPGPLLAVSAATVAPGSPETVTLTRGLGGQYDWLALAASGAPSMSYIALTYVGAGVTSRTWTVTMPTTAGVYEFRLFLNNGYTIAATSPPVTVDPTFNRLPIVSSLSPAFTGVGGPAFTLTVNGSGFVSGSVVRWNGANRPTTFLNANQLQAAIGASDVAALGTAQVSVFSPAPGGGTSASLPFSINPPPSLAVSATSVVGGTSVTVTLTNGLGGASDWLDLAATGAPDTRWVTLTYVGAGVSTRIWTVTMPLAGGTYEFRLYLNNTYTRAATSPTVSVLPGPPTLTSLSPASAPVGGAAFTLTVNGNGFGSASVVRWNGANRPTTFINANQLQAAIGASDVAALGTAQVSVFSPAPGGGTSASLPFSISPPPALTVSSTSVVGGTSVTVTLTNGVGGASDWMDLAASGAPDTSWVQLTYVGAGVTTRSWTVTMPAAGGTFEFRLYLNNTYTRAATSPTVNVSPGVTPSLAVSASTVAAGGSVTMTLTNGLGGSFDWLALAGTGAPNTSFIQWTYVGSGVASLTWTVTMPTSAGTYEFRLFLNNGYALAAKSPPVTVTP